MFFEMLNLGTKDMIQLDQAQAYGDIQISAKPKLFDVVSTPAAAAASVALASESQAGAEHFTGAVPEAGRVGSSPVPGHSSPIRA